MKMISLPVAQLDSASDSDSEGRRFESYRVGQKIKAPLRCFYFLLLSIGSTYLEQSERGRFAFEPTDASSLLVSGKAKNLRLWRISYRILDARRLANPSLRSLRVGFLFGLSLW